MCFVVVVVVFGGVNINQGRFCCIVAVAFSSLARIMGECMTIHSPPAFFLFFFLFFVF